MIPVIIGECLYDLRSALDHLAVGVMNIRSVVTVGGEAAAMRVNRQAIMYSPAPSFSTGYGQGRHARRYWP
jgi:hypothetical protein